METAECFASIYYGLSPLRPLRLACLPLQTFTGSLTVSLGVCVGENISLSVLTRETAWLEPEQPASGTDVLVTISTTTNEVLGPLPGF